jgi:hypothetical protein
MRNGNIESTCYGIMFIKVPLNEWLLRILKDRIKTKPGCLMNQVNNIQFKRIIKKISEPIVARKNMKHE